MLKTPEDDFKVLERAWELVIEGVTALHFPWDMVAEAWMEALLNREISLK